MGEGYVYIISSDHYHKQNTYKIGYSKSPKNRLSALNTGRKVSDRLRIFKKFRVFNCSKTEKRIHKYLHKYRDGKTEYFTMPYSKLEQACALIVQNDEDLHKFNQKWASERRVFAGNSKKLRPFLDKKNNELCPYTECKYQDILFNENHVIYDECNKIYEANTEHAYSVVILSNRVYSIKQIYALDWFYNETCVKQKGLKVFHHFKLQKGYGAIFKHIKDVLQEQLIYGNYYHCSIGLLIPLCKLIINAFITEISFLAHNLRLSNTICAKNGISTFLKERVDMVSGVKWDQLYSIYKIWCARNETAVINRLVFIEAIEQKILGETCLYNIKLKEDTLEYILNYVKEAVRSPPSPTIVQTETKKYLLESDTVAQFLAEMTVLSPKSAIQVSKLYNEYCGWCQEDNPMGRRKFSLSVSKQFVKKRRRHGYCFIGLALITHEDL